MAHLATAALGERVKQRRQALGWSQIQAAEHFQVHQATWSRLEHGQVRCSPALLKRLTLWFTAAEYIPSATMTVAEDENDPSRDA